MLVVILEFITPLIRFEDIDFDVCCCDRQLAHLLLFPALGVVIRYGNQVALMLPKYCDNSPTQFESWSWEKQQVSRLSINANMADIKASISRINDHQHTYMCVLVVILEIIAPLIRFEDL